MLHGGCGGGVVAWLHGAAPEMERRGRGMEIDTDSGLARSALTMWRRRTQHPDHIQGREEAGRGDMYAVCSCCVEQQTLVLSCYVSPQKEPTKRPTSNIFIHFSPHSKSVRFTDTDASRGLSLHLV